MSVAFTPWPEDLATRYRDKGYWTGRPLSDMLRVQAAGRPHDTAIVCGGRLISYADLNLRSERLAIALHRRGLRAYDTALVQLPNVAEFYIAFFALLKIGVVPVNALFSHQRYELGQYAALIEPKLLIASRGHALFEDDGFIDALRGSHGSLRHVLLLDDGNGERDLAACCDEDWHDPNAMDVVGGRIERLPMGAGPTPAGEVAFFQLSGGSTGTPKLIPRTHDDYYYSVRASADICALDPQTRFLCALPAAHNYPLSSPGALGVFHAGGTVVLAPSPEPQSCFDLIEAYRVTIAGLVPSALLLWLQAAQTRGPALRSLKLVQVGGAMLAEATARRVGPELGCKLQQVFGMAEGLVNYTRLDDDETIICTTQGRPISEDDEIRILDEAGNPVPPGQPGLLTTRGPYTFRGYYRSPEHNAAAFDADGFYCSGDIVVLRPDGYLHVVGRAKDQINRGGEKIAAEEVERLLIRHPAVRDAALVALPDAQLGEKSCAFVVMDDADVRSVALRRYLREQGIADYKLPDRFEVIPAMPLTAVGKIDKQALRARLAPAVPPANAPKRAFLDRISS
jgi:2,3-dihydroxybenzoate-AMP ligase